MVLNKNYFSDIFLVFFIAVIVRIIFFVIVSENPITYLDLFFHDSDMHANFEAAKQIVNGDYLSKDTYHPQNEWMLKIAPMEKWFEWWGGKKIFHQSPLYIYILAFLMMLFGKKIFVLKIIQLLIGSLSPVFIYLLTNLLFNRKTAIISGILSGLYFFGICYEFYFLRDFLMINLVTIFLLVFTLFKKTNKLFLLILSGAMFGVCFLAKENFLFLIPFMPFIIYNKEDSINFKIKKILYFYLGLVLICLPLFIRNYLVGAPVFAFSNRLIESLIEGYAFDSYPSYMCLPDSITKYLFNGNGEVFKTLKLIISDYPSILSFMNRIFEKILWLLFYIEPYDNISVYFIKNLNVLFDYLPNNCGIFVFAYFGLFVSFKNEENRYLIVILLILFFSLLLAPIIGRYRLIIMPFYFIYCGYGISVFSKKIKLHYITIILFFLFLNMILNYTIPVNFKNRDLEQYYVKKIILNNRR